MTTDRPVRSPELYDMVQQLTASHQHRQPYTHQGLNSTWATYHQTQVPALLMQLVNAEPAGSETMTGTTPASRPAARIEALDTIMLIDTEVGEWLDRLGEVIPADRIDANSLLTVRGTGTVAALRRLGSRHRSLPHCGASKGHRDRAKPYAEGWCCPRHHLEADVRSWWHQARIIAGYDTPAFKPHNTCPICEQRDSLRIRLDSALCVECRSIWDGPDQLGLLARHIQAENGDDTAA